MPRLGLGAILLASVVAVHGSAAQSNDAAEVEDFREPIVMDATIGYYFSTGKYGGSERTDISFVPLTVGARYDAWSLRLTVPWIRVDGVSDLTEDGSPPIVDGSVITGEGSGLGDVTLRGVYTIFPIRPWMPFVDLGARIKFPTADEDRGLGTGKFDYELQIEIARVFGRFTPFANVGYRFVGDPATFDLHNTWLASAGGVWRLRERINTGLFLYYQQSSSISAQDQLDLMPYIDWAITPIWSASSYVTAGLQTGSPDFGIGLQLTYRAQY